MALKLVSPEDNATLLNLMAKYQHLVDDGDAEGWAGLFTEDGGFGGPPDEQGNPFEFQGREELERVPGVSISQFGGHLRHNLCSFGAEYGESRDEAFARYYIIATLSPPGEPARVMAEFDVKTHLVRMNGEWKIKSNRFVLA